MFDITFDVDGVIIDEIRYVCEKHNIPYDNIKYFHITECVDEGLITREQAEVIKSSFVDEKNYRLAGLEKGADELEWIAQNSTFHINSLSCSDAVRDFKRQLFTELIPSADLNLTLISSNAEKDTYNKEVLKTDIFVEDRAETLVDKQGTYILGYLIDRPWNKLLDTSKYPNIRRVASLQAAIQFIKSDILRNMKVNV